MPITDDIKTTIMALVTGSETRLSQQALENRIRRQFGTDRKRIRRAIQELVAESALTYTYIYGTSYLEPSFQRPVRISPYIVVKPHNMDYAPLPGDIVIDIFPGISFGSGAHPTTRLSVRGIEHALKVARLVNDFQGSSVLDIGTGSGILAIAALKLGIETGLGVDTDPCARAEALTNIRLNGYAEKIRIARNTDGIASDFSLITANLRLPDLLTLCPLILRGAKTQGAIVLSGIRPHETTAITDRYGREGCTRHFGAEENGWACLVFQNR